METPGRLGSEQLRAARELAREHAKEGRAVVLAFHHHVVLPPERMPSDAHVAPLLWAAAGGVPAVLGYRSINTLDAMVGHRSPRYFQFGWTAARLDDAANFVAARVTAALVVLCARVVGGSPSGAVRNDSRPSTLS